MGEEAYAKEIEKINAQHKQIMESIEADFRTKRSKHITDMIELQGAFIDPVRKKFDPGKGEKSGFTRDMLEQGIRVHVDKLMKTYDKNKNDSFAPYLKNNITLRFGEIMKAEGISLDTAIKNKSLDAMREANIELASEDAMRTEFDQSPGGEAMHNPLKTKLVKGNKKTGKLESGEIRLSEEALLDITKKADKVQLDIGPGKRLSYKEAPNIASKWVEALAVPKAKAAKGQTKFGLDYGSAVQKRANFVANHQEQIEVAGRRNLAVDAKGQGAGTKTGLPRSLMTRQRPGESKAREVYYKDMIGADGKPATVKMSKTGVYEVGVQLKEGAKTGTILKEKIEMSREEWLAETGIVDNRTPEQIKKAIRISQKKILTAEDIKFMKEEGNVDISAIQEKLPGKNQFKDPALQTILKQHLGELGQAMSVQAIEARKSSSLDFQAKENAAQLLEAVKSGADPRLYSKGLGKTLSEKWGRPVEYANKVVSVYMMGDTRPTWLVAKEFNIETEHLQWMRDNCGNVQEGVLRAKYENVIAARDAGVAGRFRELLAEAKADPSSYSPEVVAAIEYAAKDVFSSDKGRKVLDYERTYKHFSLLGVYLSKCPGGIPPSILKAMGGDLIQGRTGIDKFAKSFRKGMSESIELSVEKKLGITKEDIGSADRHKITLDKYEKACVTEARDIINKWNEGKLILEETKTGSYEVNLEYKKYLDKPENQNTEIFRRVDGELVEIPFSDPIFRMVEEASKQAGTDMHEVFEGVDLASVSEMRTNARLQTAARKARLLDEAGDRAAADRVLYEAFTVGDNLAKDAMYYGTGIVRQELIANAEGIIEIGGKKVDARQAWIEFSYMIAKGNSNLTNGERLFVNNMYMREGYTGPEKKAMIDYMIENGSTREVAERLVEKDKVEHALASFQAGTKKALMEVNGTWANNGREFMKDWVGVYGVEGEFAKIDKIGRDTNPTGTDRFSVIGEGMKKFFVWDPAKGTPENPSLSRQTNMYDYMMESAAKDFKDLLGDNPIKELQQPHLRDFMADYLVSAGKGSGKLALKNALKNKAAEKRTTAQLDKALTVFESKGLSKVEKIELTQDIKKAIANSRNNKAKRKGMSTWDFDDTLAKTESDVLWTAPDGTKGKLNATEFAKDGAKLLEQGYKFDFSEFNKVKKGEPGPFLEKALERAKKFGTKDQFILTARAPEAAPAIKEFLDAQGFKLPIENIVGLGNSTGAAKARWMLKKFAEGYNDMYFADDAMANVEAVKYVTNRLDIKSDVQQAKRNYSLGLSVEFNQMIERKSGIEADKTFSGAKGKMLGKRRWSQSLVVPGAQDFMGLMRNFAGRGEQGNKDLQFFEKALTEPFARATKAMNEARQTAAEDMRALKKQLPSVNKKLNKIIEGSAFTHDQAIRAYLWKKAGHSIPELSEKDLKELTDFVENNADMKLFADGLLKIGRGKWSKPSNYWVGETIISDLFKLNSKENRKEYLAEWIQNKNEIFSKENLNKIEATQGSKFREALEDILYRMETGSNRPTGRNRATNAWMNFMNGSVGATMFLNSRSAMLQTISATNYINWSFNNPARAAAAFGNQKQYWSDFSMIWNSPMLKQRRAGLEYNVQEAELAAALAGQKNKAKAAVAWLIKKGFTPTQIADSFAIAAGGAGFYRNRIKDLMKKGVSKAEAEKQAWLEFQETTEKSQQSSRADLISQQQASPLGRTLLAWANTPMQYMRIQEKAFRDLINGRGDTKTNVSKIAYYGLIQSVIFGGLQNALFGHYLDDEEDLDDEDWSKSLNRTVDTVIDGQLRGFGVGGNLITALRAGATEFLRQEEKAYDDKYFTQPDHARTLLALTSVSPVIGSKLKKLYSAATEWNYNRDAISEMGMDIDNPAIDAGANVIEALTNLPTKRIVQKIDNLRDAAQGDNQMWQRISMVLGYPGWSIGAESDREESVREAKSEGKKNRKNNKSQQSNAAAESENKRDQQRQRNSGQTVTCAAVTGGGTRCKNKTKSGGAYCSYHEKVPQSSTQVQCSHVKKGGKRCKMKTKNKSGKCMYHD